MPPKILYTCLISFGRINSGGKYLSLTFSYMIFCLIIFGLQFSWKVVVEYSLGFSRDE